jgi:HK97 family phage major capsid protein
MNITEISENVNKLASSWEYFKSVNDQRLKELEKRGTVDPLTDLKLSRINESLDEYKSKIDQIETAINRPNTNFNQKSTYDEHAYAFNQYLRKGNEHNLLGLERKSMSVASSNDGGYLVSSQMSKTIISSMHQKSIMRQLASIETISTDSLDLLEDIGTAGAGWASETEARIETSTPELNKRKIYVHELYAQPKATQKLIDDSNIDIEKWLVNKLVDVFAFKEDESFINGDGKNKPFGILSYAEGNTPGKIDHIKSNLNGSLTSDSLLKLHYSLNESFLQNASFLMHRSALQEVRLLKEKNSGRYLWSPSLSMDIPSTLLGAPVFVSNHLPALDKDSKSIILADFKAAYKIVDRIGIRVLRDPFTDKPFVKFYTTKRVGGDVVNSEAIKIMKMSV